MKTWRTQHQSKYKVEIPVDHWWKTADRQTTVHAMTVHLQYFVDQWHTISNHFLKKAI